VGLWVSPAGLPVVTGLSEAGHAQKKEENKRGTGWLKSLGHSVESQADWGIIDGLD